MMKIPFLTKIFKRKKKEEETDVYKELTEMEIIRELESNKIYIGKDPSEALKAFREENDAPKTGTYIDRLPGVKKMTIVNYKGYTARSYVDYCMGKEFYNLNIFKDARNLIHCTMSKLLSESELKDRIDDYIKYNDA